MAYLGNSPGVASQRVETALTATASQTVFTPSSGYTLGYCDVYQNGVKLVNGDDYTAANGTTITLATGAASGDSIVIVASFPRGLSDGYLKSEADAKYLTIANPTASGNLNFTGTSNRITGDFSNTTVGSRAMFQTSTANSATRVNVVPTGTGTVGEFGMFNNSDTTSAGYAAVRMRSGDMQITSEINGSASYLPMTFFTGGSERVRVDVNGMLGVGVIPGAWTSAAGKGLQINNVGNTIWANGAGSVSISANATYDSGWKYTNSAGNAARLDVGNGNGTCSWGIASGTGKNAGDALTWSTTMTLGATGRLILTPTGGFVSAPTGTDMTSAAGFSMSLGGGDYFSIGQMSGSHVWMQAAYGAQPNLAYYNMHLQPNGGNVIIGRGSNYSNSYKLQVGNGSTAAAMYLDSNGSGAWIYGVDSTNYPSGGWIIGHITTTANKLQARCGSSGGLEMTSGGTSWSAISDERLKDIIEPIENAASKVSSLRAVIGKYKTDEEGTRRSFLIAQDVQAVLPEAVSVTKASKEDPEDYLTVAYTDLIPLLVAAAKEQQAIIEQLRADVETLKGAQA